MALYFRLDKTAPHGVRVTSRYCNISCVWCHDDYFRHSGFVSIGNSEFVEIIKRILVAASEDTAYVRFAGSGDPTVCGGDDLSDLVVLLRKLPQVKKIKMTTNGVLLGGMVEKLRYLDSVNISLNAMRPETYHEYARYDGFSDVISSVERAVKAGMTVKINSIYWKKNENDIDLYENLSQKYGGMPIKFVDLLVHKDEDAHLFVPLSQLEDFIMSKVVNIREETHPYPKRIYTLKSGAIFEVKIAGRLNNCPNLSCLARSICLEGCRHSIRIGLDGSMQPCGVRLDNKLNLLDSSVTDKQIVKALYSGGKVSEDLYHTIVG